MLSGDLTTPFFMLQLSRTRKRRRVKMAALARPGQGSTSAAGEDPRTTRATTVSVDDYETWVEAKRYTVYKMVVRLPGKAYFIFRRSLIEDQPSYL